MQPPLTTPGVYPGPAQAVLLRANEQQFLFQLQDNALGKASIGVQLERVKGSFYPLGVSFEISFTNSAGVPADPGTFQVDIQTADNDADANYATKISLAGTSAAALNASFVGRVEITNMWAKYTRVKVVTLPNAVRTTVQVTH